MQNSKKTIGLMLLAASLGLAQTAMAQSDPSVATKTAAPDNGGKILGCVLGPEKYGYNKQCSMTGG